MSNYVRFDQKDIQTIIAMVDELAPLNEKEKDERRPEEIALYNKACQILTLMQAAADKVRPVLFRDPENGRLTIQYGQDLSEPVPYNGIATLGNFFAVTDFYSGIFPTNVLMRFIHVNPDERKAWESQKAEMKQSKNGIRKPRWQRRADSDAIDPQESKVQ